MLKMLATLAYDVLGGRTAFILKGRVLLQQSYLPRPHNNKTYNWDDAFVEPLLSKWLEFVEEIPLLQGFTLPRHLPCTTPFRIVCMRDASNTCIAGAAWLVWENAETESEKDEEKCDYSSRLILCRGKVRALKDSNSIAKAELQAMSLSRELILTIQAA